MSRCIGGRRMPMKSRTLVLLTPLVFVDASVRGQGTVESRGLRLRCDGVSPGYHAPCADELRYNLT